MAYVYKHTRLDKNEVFYIGIGSDAEFKRAYDLKGRNNYWYNVVNVTDYEVEIVYSGLTIDEACLKEITLIKQYGRKKEGGSLVNLTEGGEGFRSNHTAETKHSISEALSGKTYEELHGDEKANELKSRRRDYALQKWESYTQEERQGLSDKISASLKGIKRTFKTVVCPHCDKSGGENVMYRFHFDNCNIITGKERTLSAAHKAALKGIKKTKRK